MYEPLAAFLGSAWKETPSLFLDVQSERLGAIGSSFGESPELVRSGDMPSSSTHNCESYIH
jgi:hypothetical protein